MTYYTNSNCIEDLMTQIADVEVKKLTEVGECTNVTVYLFDNLFDWLGRVYENHGSFDVHNLLWHRPEWRGVILDLMKRHEKVICFVAIGVNYCIVRKGTISVLSVVMNPSWMPTIHV